MSEPALDRATAVTVFAIEKLLDRLRAHRSGPGTEFDETLLLLERTIVTALAEVERLREVGALSENGRLVLLAEREELRQRAEAAEACRSCKGTGQATGRISCVCGGSGKEDDAHERLIDRSFDYDVLRDKLAEAQQREAWWRERLDLECRYEAGNLPPPDFDRLSELRRLLGLDQEGDR